jgi:hypothetical protein
MKSYFLAPTLHWAHSVGLSAYSDGQQRAPAHNVARAILFHEAVRAFYPDASASFR